MKPAPTARWQRLAAHAELFDSYRGVVLLLLLGVLYYFAAGMAALIKESNAAWLVRTCLGAGVLAYTLAIPGRRGVWAWLVMLFGGTGWLLLQAGRLWGRAAGFGTALLVQSGAAAQTEMPVWNPVPVIDSLLHLSAGVHGLLARCQGWLRALVEGKPSFDPVAAGLFWALGLGLLSLWAGWWARRGHSALTAALPLLAVLSGTAVYSQPSLDTQIGPLVGFTGGVLLLQGATSLARNRRHWLANGIQPSPVALEMGLAVASLTAVFLLTGSLTPSLTWEQARRAAQEFFQPSNRVAGEDRAPISQAFGLEAPSGDDALAQNPDWNPGLPRQHLLGAGPELSQKHMMWVSVKGYAPQTPAQLLGASPAALPPRVYWRSQTYDVYTGSGWYTLPNRDAMVAPGAPLPPPPFIAPDNLRPLTQSVQVVGEGGAYLFAAGEPVGASQPFRAYWRGQNDLFAAQVTARAYTAQSVFAQVSLSGLRGAGENYPDWVRERYLRLPDDVPDAVRSLAYQLTAAQPTPYDRASAIETYLRTFPYTLDLPAPPAGQDVTAYFLFDLQKGYCDYFATAMVVLAREVGLPARLAVGYASGSYDPIQARFTVTQADAHAWPEIFFPQFGWVPFEPTSGRAPIQRLGQEEEAQPAALVGTTPPPADMLALPPILVSLQALPWPAMIAAGLGVIGLGWFWFSFDFWRLSRCSSEGAIEDIYRRILDIGQKLKVDMKRTNTPIENCSLLCSRLEEVVPPGRRMQLALVEEELDRFLVNYHKLHYSQRRVDTKDKDQTIQAWRRIRRACWFARWYQFARRRSNGI